jgi:hypothetical protein
MSLIEELIVAQKARNEWMRTATPEQKRALNRIELLQMAAIEPELAWIADALTQHETSHGSVDDAM